MPEKRHVDERFEFVLDDHDDIRHEIAVIHGALTARLGKVEDVSALLEGQVDSLRRHFAEEEASGLFDTIVEQTPRFANRASSLCQEHAQLLQQIRHVAEKASQTQGTAGWWERIEQLYHDFCKELMHHETAENHLLQESYTEDIAAED